MKLMKHFKQLGLMVLISLLAWSCAERTICPAYQSAFIHDKDALTKHFSYFKEDSTPKLLSASKNKFGIGERQPYWKKVRSLNTIKVETIYPQLDDSTQLAGDIILQAEMDVVDSVALDSAAVNEIGWTEHFNVEQEFYFYYFNDILVYPEERAVLAAADAQKDKIDKDQADRTGEKQNVFQKFLSLFKKKQPDEDLTDDLTDDENADEEGVDSPPKKKKKLFSFGKKKNKKPKADPAPTEEVVEEEEDEDDDF
jgi:hypothetical protein